MRICIADVHLVGYIMRTFREVRQSWIDKVVPGSKRWYAGRSGMLLEFFSRSA
jgi:hypothetical protein